MAVRWIMGAMRQALACALACALILAPVIIAATHGPGLPTEGVLSAEQLLHGHSHDESEPGQSGVAHDATDHEHQTQMVLTQTGDLVFQRIGSRIGMPDVHAGSLAPSGPMRPPKATSV